MTTVWEPDLDELLARVAEMEGADDVEANVEADDGDGANQGTKRKRAPPTKGVKWSSCKACSACPHGRQRSRQGVRWCIGLRARSSRRLSAREHGVISARSAVGLKSASTVVSAHIARSVVGHQSASMVVSAHIARSAVGLKSASTVVSAHCANSAVGRLRARSSYARRKECGGSQICEHGRMRSTCKECGGSQICEHGRSTVVVAIGARSAVGAQSASTVVTALAARSAAGLLSASTVVALSECNLRARALSVGVLGLESASTVVYALSARSAPNAASASSQQLYRHVSRARGGTIDGRNILSLRCPPRGTATPAAPPSPRSSSPRRGPTPRAPRRRRRRLGVPQQVLPVRRQPRLQFHGEREVAPAAAVAPVIPPSKYPRCIMAMTSSHVPLPLRQTSARLWPLS